MSPIERDVQNVVDQFVSREGYRHRRAEEFIVQCTSMLKSVSCAYTASSEHLVSFVRSCAELWSSQEEEMRDIEDQVARDIVERRHRYDAKLRELEDKFSDSVELLERAPSEETCIERFAKALAVLSAIDAGYRKKQKGLESVVRLLEASVNQSLDQYLQALLSHFRLKKMQVKAKPPPVATLPVMDILMQDGVDGPLTPGDPGFGAGTLEPPQTLQVRRTQKSITRKQSMAPSKAARAQPRLGARQRALLKIQTAKGAPAGSTLQPTTGGRGSISSRGERDPSRSRGKIAAAAELTEPDIDTQLVLLEKIEAMVPEPIIELEDVDVLTIGDSKYEILESEMPSSQEELDKRAEMAREAISERQAHIDKLCAQVNLNAAELRQVREERVREEARLKKEEEASGENDAMGGDEDGAMDSPLGIIIPGSGGPPAAESGERRRMPLSARRGPGARRHVRNILRGTMETPTEDSPTISPAGSEAAIGDLRRRNMSLASTKSAKGAVDEGDDNDVVKPEAPLAPPAMDKYVAACFTEKAVISFDGSLCFEVKSLSDELKRRIFVTFRRALLEHVIVWAKDMRQHAKRVTVRREQELIEELERTLSQHRPRPGRLEFGPFESRRTAVLHHKKLADRHFAMIRQRIPALSNVVEGDIDKLMGFREQVLVSLETSETSFVHANNSAALRKIMIECRSLVDRWKGTAEALCSSVRDAICNQELILCSANKRFVETCRTFENGGDYDESEIDALITRVTEVDAEIRKVGEELVSRVCAMENDFMEFVGDRFRQLRNVLGPLFDDISVIESANVVHSSLLMRIRAEFVVSERMENRLFGVVSQLDALVACMRRHPGRTFNFATPYVTIDQKEAKAEEERKSAKKDSSSRSIVLPMIDEQTSLMRITKYHRKDQARKAGSKGHSSAEVWNALMSHNPKSDRLVSRLVLPRSQPLMRLSPVTTGSLRIAFESGALKSHMESVNARNKDVASGAAFGVSYSDYGAAAAAAAAITPGRMRGAYMWRGHNLSRLTQEPMYVRVIRALDCVARAMFQRAYYLDCVSDVLYQRDVLPESVSEKLSVYPDEESKQSGLFEAPRPMDRARKARLLTNRVIGSLTMALSSGRIATGAKSVASLHDEHGSEDGIENGNDDEGGSHQSDQDSTTGRHLRDGGSGVSGNAAGVVEEIMAELRPVLNMHGLTSLVTGAEVLEIVQGQGIGTPELLAQLVAEKLLSDPDGSVKSKSEDGDAAAAEQQQGTQGTQGTPVASQADVHSQQPPHRGATGAPGRGRRARGAGAGGYGQYGNQYNTTEEEDAAAAALSQRLKGVVDTAMDPLREGSDTAIEHYKRVKEARSIRSNVVALSSENVSGDLPSHAKLMSIVGQELLRHRWTGYRLYAQYYKAAKEKRIAAEESEAAQVEASQGAEQNGTRSASESPRRQSPRKLAHSSGHGANGPPGGVHMTSQGGASGNSPRRIKARGSAAQGSPRVPPHHERQVVQVARPLGLSGTNNITVGAHKQLHWSLRLEENLTAQQNHLDCFLVDAYAHSKAVRADQVRRFMSTAQVLQYILSRSGMIEGVFEDALAHVNAVTNYKVKLLHKAFVKKQVASHALRDRHLAALTPAMAHPKNRSRLQTLVEDEMMRQLGEIDRIRNHRIALLKIRVNMACAAAEQLSRVSDDLLRILDVLVLPSDILGFSTEVGGSDQVRHRSVKALITRNKVRQHAHATNDVLGRTRQRVARTERENRAAGAGVEMDTRASKAGNPSGEPGSKMTTTTKDEPNEENPWASVEAMRLRSEMICLMAAVRDGSCGCVGVDALSAVVQEVVEGRLGSLRVLQPAVERVVRHMDDAIGACGNDDGAGGVPPGASPKRRTVARPDPYGNLAPPGQGQGVAASPLGPGGSSHVAQSHSPNTPHAGSKQSAEPHVRDNESSTMPPVAEALAAGDIMSMPEDSLRLLDGLVAMGIVEAGVGINGTDLESGGKASKQDQSADTGMYRSPRPNRDGPVSGVRPRGAVGMAGGPSAEYGSPVPVGNLPSEARSSLARGNVEDSAVLERMTSIRNPSNPLLTVRVETSVVIERLRRLLVDTISHYCGAAGATSDSFLKLEAISTVFRAPRIQPGVVGGAEGETSASAMVSQTIGSRPASATRQMRQDYDGMRDAAEGLALQRYGALDVSAVSPESGAALTEEDLVLIAEDLCSAGGAMHQTVATKIAPGVASGRVGGSIPSLLDTVRMAERGVDVTACVQERCTRRARPGSAGSRPPSGNKSSNSGRPSNGGQPANVGQAASVGPSSIARPQSGLSSTGGRRRPGSGSGEGERMGRRSQGSMSSQRDLQEDIVDVDSEADSQAGSGVDSGEGTRWLTVRQTPAHHFAVEYRDRLFAKFCTTYRQALVAIDTEMNALLKEASDFVVNWNRMMEMHGSLYLYSQSA